MQVALRQCVHASACNTQLLMSVYLHTESLLHILSIVIIIIFVLLGVLSQVTKVSSTDNMSPHSLLTWLTVPAAHMNAGKLRRRLLLTPGRSGSNAVQKARWK